MKSKSCNTPFGCLLISADSGRCGRYSECSHASVCLGISIKKLAGDGFATLFNKCPGFSPTVQFSEGFCGVDPAEPYTVHR